MISTEELIRKDSRNHPLCQTNRSASSAEFGISSGLKKLPKISIVFIKLFVLNQKIIQKDNFIIRKFKNRQIFIHQSLRSISHMTSGEVRGHPFEAGLTHRIDFDRKSDFFYKWRISFQIQQTLNTIKFSFDAQGTKIY